VDAIHPIATRTGKAAVTASLHSPTDGRCCLLWRKTRERDYDVNHCCHFVTTVISCFQKEEMIMRTAQAKNNGLADDRITARVPHSTRTIIERAAAVYGATISQFVIQASVERANEVLRSMEMVKLSSQDARIFIDALTNPPAPNKRLQEAVRAHKKLVESRD
jgi:uncharacterized protein (DUF1778 family)